MCVGLFEEHKANLFLLPILLNMAFILWISSESKSFLEYETILCFTFCAEAERKQPKALNYSEAVLTSQGFSLASFFNTKMRTKISINLWRHKLCSMEMISLSTRAVDD